MAITVTDKPAASNCSSKFDESDLVERAKTCPQAFGRLYEHYYGQILNYVYRQTLDINTAEELTSNTFFKALRGLPTYRDQGMFRAWLYRIATNELKMHWRNENKQKQQHTVLPVERICVASTDDAPVDDVEETLHSFTQLKTALDRLPDRYRSAIELRFFEKMPYAEIAQVMGKRTGTIKSLVHRGLRRLRQLMVEKRATISRGLHSGE